MARSHGGMLDKLSLLVKLKQPQREYDEADVCVLERNRVYVPCLPWVEFRVCALAQEATARQMRLTVPERHLHFQIEINSVFHPARLGDIHIPL